MLTQGSSFFLSPPTFLDLSNINSLRNLAVLVSSKQEWILNLLEIIFQVSLVSIAGLLEWKCGRSMNVYVWEKGVCSSDNCAVVPHTCVSFCVNAKCHGFCFWHLSATAGASGCTFVVVSESEKPFVERLCSSNSVGGGGAQVRVLRAFTGLQSLISISTPSEPREGFSLVYPQRNVWMHRNVWLSALFEHGVSGILLSVFRVQVFHVQSRLASKKELACSLM